MNRLRKNYQVADLLDLIDKQEKQTRKTINLMPIENYLSPLALQALSTDCVNRYCLGNTKKRTSTGWYTPGEKTLIKLENKTNNILKKIFMARYVISRPLGGLQAMQIVLIALNGTNKRMLSIPKKLGGHAATSKIAKLLGYEWMPLPFTDTDSPKVDIIKLKATCLSQPVSLIYLDLACIIEPVELKKIRNAICENTIICYDGSHVLGLIAGRQFQKPLEEGANILCGSLHKTFFGPQRGAIFTNSIALWKRIDRVAQTLVSNRHYNDVATLGISALEMHKFGKVYAKQIIKNASELASQLEKLGFNVVKSKSSYTKTHQVWIKFDMQDAKKFVHDAYKANIILNRYLLPGFKSPGLRLGVQGVTRLGMTKKEMKSIAIALKKVRENKVLEAKEIVNNLKKKFINVRFGYPAR